jgi:hypothetical protein
MPETEPRPFNRATLEAAFQRIGEMAVAAGKIVEISVYGGSALVLTLNHRPFPPGNSDFEFSWPLPAICSL